MPKRMRRSLSDTNRRATERHLPYRITQCYLPPYSSRQVLE